MPPIVAGLLVLGSLLFALLLIVRPLGAYIADVATGERTVLTPVVGPVERGTYRVLGIERDAEQTWAAYAVSVLLGAASFILLIGMELLRRRVSSREGHSPEL